MEKKKPECNNILKSTAGLVISLAVFFFAFFGGGVEVFGWFTNNKETDIKGVNINVFNDDIRAEYHVYSYDIRDMFDFAATVPSDAYTETDPETNLTVNTAYTLKKLKMNPYDRVFIQRNDFTPVVVRVALTGTMLPRSGTVDIVINRDTGKNDVNLKPKYFTSVVKFTCIKGTQFYSNDIPTMFESVARQVNNTPEGQIADKNVFKTMATSENVLSFYTDIETRTEKRDTLSFALSYNAGDFNGTTLNFYLYFDYHKNLIEEFISENVYGNLSLDETEISADNDLLSISARPRTEE